MSAAARRRPGAAHGGRRFPIRNALFVALGLAAWAPPAIYALRYGGRWYLDLQVYRAAGRLARAGANPYHAMFTSTHLPFTYPPFALGPAAALSLLTPSVARVAWWIANAGALTGVVAVAIGASGIGGARGHAAAPATGRAPGGAQAQAPGGAQSQAPGGAQGQVHRSLRTPTGFALAALWAGASALVLEPVRSTFDYGQVNVLLLLLVMVDLLVIPRRAQGLATGFAAAFKLTPLVFVLAWIARGDRRSAGRMVATFGFATLAAWAVFPRPSTTYWLHQILHPSRTWDVAGERNQSLLGLLERAGHGGGAAVVVAWIACSAAVAVVALLAARRLHQERCDVAAVFVVALCGLLVSPISWSHHWVCVVLVPVVTWELRRSRTVIALGAVLLVVAVVAPYWFVAGGPWYPVSSEALVLAGGGFLVATWVVVAWGGGGSRVAAGGVVRAPAGGGATEVAGRERGRLAG